MPDIELYDRAVAWARRRDERHEGRSRLLIAVNLVRNMVEDRVAGLAAEMSFWALLSMVPLLVTIASLLGYAESIVGAADLERGRIAIIDTMSVVFSRDLTRDVMEPFVTSLFAQQRGGAAVTSLILALYLASRVFTATIRSLDLAYRVPERRGLLLQRTLAFMFAAGFVVVIVVTLLAMVVGPLLGSGQLMADRIGAGQLFDIVWSIGRWPLLIAVMVGFLAAVYLWGPNVENTLRECLPGAVLGVAAWMLASLALRLYLAAGGGGTPALTTEDQAVALVGRVLGAVVAVLLWTYVTGLAILAGGELNAELARQRR